MSARPAINLPQLDEAEPYADLLRRSITELCTADHQNDPAKLAPWLANKTAEQVRAWIGRDDLIVRVAALDKKPAGFGLAARSGEIRLMYVAPEARYRGVSSALLSSLEDELRAAGLEKAVLNSTATAHNFYRSRGWVNAGGPETDQGLVSYPMAKQIKPT